MTKLNFKNVTMKWTIRGGNLFFVRIRPQLIKGPEIP